MTDTTNAAVKPAIWLIVLIVLIGAVSRIAPLFDQDGRMLQQFPTEDGYLMLTIARNIALGNGFSTSDGTIPTNGTQPLSTVFYAGSFAATGGDKAAGVFGVLAMQFVFSIVAAFVFWRLYRHFLKGTSFAGGTEALAVATWWAMPISLRHTNNCLESGLYVLLIGACALMYFRMIEGERERDTPISWPAIAGFGLLLGFTFLARIDACWVILAFCLVHTGYGFLEGKLSTRLAQTVVFGAISVVVAAPWLIFNQVKFGSIMPISGTSESSHVHLFINKFELAPSLLEYMGMVGLVPNSLQLKPAVAIVLALVCAAAAVPYLYLLYRAQGTARRVGIVGLLIIVFLTGFYGVTFGAPHFVTRYLFPASIFLSIGWAVIGVALYRWAKANLPVPQLAMALPIFAVVSLLYFDVREYRRGVPHQHWQVIEWMNENVPDEAWAGAVQTGTLGFFHDRTLNLDGKVNPYALEARLKNEIPAYVVESDMDYLIDWVGIATWYDDYEIIRENFDLVVRDEEKDLAALVRKKLKTPVNAEDER